MSAPLSLGIDIGGTFTDLVIHDPRDGRAVIWKESTTPDDPARGALEGTRRVLEKAGAKPQQIGRVVHATTLFTNALIERKGAKTGLLTTAGFADVLEIARERKYELYDLFIELPKPLVARPWRREAKERLAPDGTVEIALDVEAAMAEVTDLVKQGVESLAICFLHSYANPAHERAIGAAVAERFQNLSISLSSDIAPEIREYQRASTTVTNAYVRPLAEIYLERLEQALRAEGIPGGLFLMLSNGGLTHVSEAKRAPVQLMESGPAAGALAGAWFGRNAGLERVLAFDMGGTTAKLALVDDGEPLVAWGFEAAREKRFLRGSGLPIAIATVELIEIGAGGGSIARKSDLGTLNVGPESSGAQPGPACYGRGGTEATVTDADLTLGYLNADFFLGGAMKIDGAATGAAFGRLAETLGVDSSRAAFGVHDVVNENMAGAARVAIAERGRVPVGVRAAGNRRRGPGSCLARRAQARRHARRLPARRGRGQHHRHADGAGAGRSRGEFQRGAGRRRLESGLERLCRPREGFARRAAPHRRGSRGTHRPPPRRHALYRPGQRDHRGVARPVVGRRREDRFRSRLQGAVCPHATGCRDPVRGAAAFRIGADARHWRQARAAAPSLGRGAEGHTAGVLPRRGQDAVDPGVGPLCVGAGGKHRGSGGVRGERKHLHRRPWRHRAPVGRRLHSGRGGVMTRTFDPIELELLWRRLISLVDEAAAAMVRTSFSTLVRESYDFSCVVTDAAGQSLVQASESIPSFIGTLPETVKHFLRFFPPDQLQPGDVLITNDIWLGTGHLPDITLAKPIFRDGKLVAFSATTAHAPDIGGKIRSPEPREVFEEGLQIPPMKMIAAGKTDETLVTIIRKNVRTPDQTMGDLWAQVVALDLMEDRLRVLMENYGLPDLTDLAREIQGRCETAMRAAIRELPDGTYHSELKTDGLLDKPITHQDGAHHQGRRDRHRLRRHRPPGRSRDQLCALLHQRHVHVRGQGLHQPRPAQQRRRVAADHPHRAAGLHRQSAIPRAGRLAHADRPLHPDAGVRLPGPGRAGARDGGLRLADVGHEPVRRAGIRWEGGRPALRQHVLLQRRHGRQHAR